MISLHDALGLVSFTPGEERDLKTLEATIDSSLYKFEGAPITLNFDQNLSPKLAYAVQKKYAAGGWHVNIQTSPTPRFVFIPVYTPTGLTPIAAPATVRAEKALPPVLTVAPGLPGQKRLLVRMPTRGRPAQALEVLAKYRAMAGCPITIEVVIDEDDETMMDACVLQRLYALGCVVTVGNHRSKIAAVNAGRGVAFDVLLLASDDMCPVDGSYAVRVLEKMAEHWPHDDGAIYFDDGHQNSALCTLPVIGRRLLDRFDGKVYSDAYQSLFCDTEQTQLWQEMGRLIYVDECIIEHRHHVWGKSQNDALYQKNDALWDVDKKIYEARKTTQRAHAQFTFDTPPLFLSICICTMSERKSQLTLLVDELYRQIGDLPEPFEVDVLIDDKGGTIGEKRQRLIEKAKGTFVCFVDDDDAVSHRYVERLVNAIRSNPHADCLSLSGVMTTAGGVPEKFEHSITHREWEFRDGVHLRGPNHLSPVRRNLALKAGFPSKNHAEDHAYSVALRPLLKTEIETGEDPLYYYLFHPAKN